MSRHPDDSAIRARIAALTEATHRRSVDDTLAVYAADPVLFDIAPPLQSGGEGREALQRWFDSWQDGPDLEVSRLAVAVDGDVAFSHSLNRLGGTRTDGSSRALWMRVTFGWRRRDGEWWIVHAHSSVPMAMDGSDRALVDLTPEGEAR